MLSRYMRGFLLALIVVILQSTLDQAQGQDSAPKPNYASPSHQYTLNVKSDQPDGNGPASYRLMQRGRVVWSGRQAFTLQSAVISDKGIVGGYTYPGGIDGNILEVVIIDLSGKLRQDERIRRTLPPITDTPAKPTCSGVFLDQAQSVLVVMLDTYSQSSPFISIWQQFQLSTGQRLPDFDPNQLVPRRSSSAWVIAATPVSSTPLTLMYGMDGDDGWFVLLNATRKTVWSTRFRNDYASSPYNVDLGQAIGTVKFAGAILPCSEPRRFTLRSIAKAVRITYAVAPGPAGTWKVTEVSRKPFPLPHFDKSMEGEGQVPTTHRIDAFTFADNGRIAILRDNVSAMPAIVVMDAAGTILSMQRIPKMPAASARPWSCLAWQGGTHFLVGRTAESPATESLWTVDTAAHTAKPVKGVGVDSVKCISALPDGRFAILGEVLAATGPMRVIDVYTPTGKRIWRSPVSEFSSVDGVSVTTDGRIAAIEVVRSTVTYYAAASGKYLSSADLGKQWKGPIPYMSSIWPDAGGGLIVLDFGEPSRIIRIDSDGHLRTSFVPHRKDGSFVDCSIYGASLSPEGVLWTTDGSALYQLDETGAVTKTVR